MALPFDVAKMSTEQLQFLIKPIATYNNILINENELSKHLRLSSRPQRGPTDIHLNLLQCGRFGVLPNELINKIFSKMTVRSLLRLRATCSSLEALIGHWPPFSRAMTDARPVLSALIGTGASRLWTFTDIDNTIYTTECCLCGQHGEIIHLLKMKRVCFNCLTTDRRLLAVDHRYAQESMNLSLRDLNTIPHLTTIAQPSFFGKEGIFKLAVDYTAAVELATKSCQTNKKRKRSEDIESDTSVPLTPTGEFLPFKRQRCGASGDDITRIPIHVRRAKQSANNNHQKFHLQDYLLEPPESALTQHACCIHLPGLEVPSRLELGTKPARKVKAYLCAGCSFYFNYHSPLPHQTHTLYAHEDDWTSKRSPKTTDIRWTPLMAHIRDCPFARLYWSHLNPRQHLPTATNPLLEANGGPKTARELREKLQNHQIAALAPTESNRYRHFQRHTFDPVLERRVDMATNNEHFEHTPFQFLDILRERGQGHGQDPKGDGLTHKFVADTLVNHSCAGWAQSHWATARASHANNLFRGWRTLLDQRRRHEMRFVASKGGRVGRSYHGYGGLGWGFDRFGCTSQAG